MDLDGLAGGLNDDLRRISNASIDDTLRVVREAGTAEVRLSIPFNVGILIRGLVRNELRRACDLMGLEYSLKEYKGFLGSGFLFKVSGPANLILPIVEWRSRLG